MLTITPKFDKYLLAAVPSGGNTPANLNPHSPLNGNCPPNSSFGEERIIEARRRRMARDSLQAPDPHAELNQYLREPLVPTSCPVPIWWKVRAAVSLTMDSNRAIRRTMPPGSQLWQRLPLTTSRFRVPLSLQRGHSRVRVLMMINAVVGSQLITLGACNLLRPTVGGNVTGRLLPKNSKVMFRERLG